MNNTLEPIIIERKFKAPPKIVWSAITDLQQMKQWYFQNIPSFEPKVGFKTKFTVHVEDRVYPHIWSVTEVDDEKKISYNWEFEGYKGLSNTSFEIFEEEDGTTLKLTAVILKPFPSDILEFKKESAVSGWNYLINEKLKLFLEKE